MLTAGIFFSRETDGSISFVLEYVYLAICVVASQPRNPAGPDSRLGGEDKTIEYEETAEMFSSTYKDTGIRQVDGFEVYEGSCQIIPWNIFFR